MHYTIPRTILATNLKLLQSAPTKSYREASNSSTSLIIARGPVAQWIRHRPTEPGIAGSSPAGVIPTGCFNYMHDTGIPQNFKVVF